MTARDAAARVPPAHGNSSATCWTATAIQGSTEEGYNRKGGGDLDAAPPFSPDSAIALLKVAFRHPIKLVANALGVPPPEMIQMGRDHGRAGRGARRRQGACAPPGEAGVDVIVAQGGEAGGHCGEVSTLVLVPEVVRALKAAGRDIPVLAAGGIMTGRQMAGCMAMGAAGVWTGSVWLATTESETSEVSSREDGRGPVTGHSAVSRDDGQTRAAASVWLD